MTLVVGFNMRRYILIGADTRVCYFPSDSSVDWRDDEEKIQPTSMGLISGAGLINFLDPVKERLEQQEITNTDQIRDVIRAERHVVEQRWPNPSQRVRDGINHTAWMLSYINGDASAKSIDDVRLRLAVTLPHEDYTLALVGADSGKMIPPSGLKPDDEEELRAMCHDGTTPWNGQDDALMDNLTQHCILIAKVMRRASEISDMVAPTFQLGVHMLGLVGSSSIVGPDFNFAWRWHQGGDDSASS